MNTHEREVPGDPVEELDALELELEEVDAADASKAAEEIARRLERSLDEIDGASGSVAS
jgi:ribosome-binding ATPase YchF (GTP1/OBG family)